MLNRYKIYYIPARLIWSGALTNYQKVMVYSSYGQGSAKNVWEARSEPWSIVGMDLSHY